jgi:hypothetical protein
MRRTRPDRAHAHGAVGESTARATTVQPLDTDDMVNDMGEQTKKTTLRWIARITEMRPQLLCYERQDETSWLRHDSMESCRGAAEAARARPASGHFLEPFLGVSLQRSTVLVACFVTGIDTTQ